MKKISTLLIIISISLCVAGVFTPAPAHPLPINIELSGKTFSTEAVMVFDGEIKPFIQTKFKEDISDEYLIVQRKLLKVNLYRVEVIDGRDVYSVHIDFVVRITERESGFSHTTLRGQETLFLIKGGKIVDVIPFDEYVTEQDEKKIKKELAAEDTEKKRDSLPEPALSNKNEIASPESRSGSQ